MKKLLLTMTALLVLGMFAQVAAQNESNIWKTLAKITDGTSNTMLVGEKFIRPDLYEGGSSSDDRGWSDGWDPDSMRSTCFPPLQDAITSLTSDDSMFGFFADVPNFGSPHPGGFNCVFADGSVRTISYDIDPEVFDFLGDRQDGQVIDTAEVF